MFNCNNLTKPSKILILLSNIKIREVKFYNRFKKLRRLLSRDKPNTIDDN